jgi:hypothetical protein
VSRPFLKYKLFIRRTLDLKHGNVIVGKIEICSAGYVFPIEFTDMVSRQI